MRIKWIILLLLLLLPIITAEFSAPVGTNSSLTIFDKDKQVLLRSDRLKRQCGPCGVAPSPVIVCCGAAGLKEIFRSWWLHIPLLLLPMSTSWLKTMVC
ncbi:putative inactive deaminase [Dirofilaria immitis]